MSKSSRTQKSTALALARELISVPNRLRRNPELIDAMSRLLVPRRSGDREDAIKDLTTLLHRKQIEWEAEGVEEAAKGFAGLLLQKHPEIEQHATGVVHLGSLAPLARLPASRWDYVRLLVKTLLQIKQRQPGLGLGSSNFGLSHGKNSLSGLEIAQAWALLANYGHLFGTFATERGLMYALDSDHSCERDFLRQVDAEVRGPVEEVIRRRDFYRAHVAIGAWRVSHWPASSIRSTSLLLLSRLLAHSSERSWGKLMWAFTRARQLTYTRLHSMIGGEIATSPIPVATAVRELRGFSDIGFLDAEHEPASAVVGLVDALDRFYADVFFASPTASERVLSHLKDFKNWWRSRSNDTLQARLEGLAHQPSDWPNSEPRQRKHFVRLQIPDAGIGWVAEVKHWLESRDAWQDANFLLTPSKRANAGCSLVDVYTSGLPRLELIAHLARLLAERNESTWTAYVVTDTHRSLWRSIAAFALSLFQFLLRPGCRAQLEPLPAKDGVGLAIAAKSVSSGCGRLADFARRVQDDGRRVELDALHDASLQYGDGQGTWLAFLGRLRILDEETGKPLQELDGVAAFISNACIDWHFVEHKDGGASGMRSQLNDLGEYLAFPVPPSSFIDVQRGKAAQTIVKWGGPANVHVRQADKRGTRE
ncbi:hypothetical protein WMF45_13520 [Sorangium sp. So ce448]|uniref:hypothetical protein n=1 Tax=Sorangium sp. So ce448 TaxID=3133314 RepID=UPI003F643377